MRRTLVPLVVLSAPVPLTAQALVPRPTGPLVLEHPCPRPGAFFGHAVGALDMDGDGLLDVAVGAWGEGAVYVFYGATTGAAASPWRDFRVFDPYGPVQCPSAPNGTQFGYDLAGGELDGDEADELAVGAPQFAQGGTSGAGAVFVFGGASGATPLVLAPTIQESGQFGSSVTVGDFDGDGRDDLAVSAIKGVVAGVAAGRVYVFRGPLTASTVPLVIDNPNPVEHGNFGIHLAVGDHDADGLDDLYVSGIGNTANGVPVAGQVFCYPGPLDPAVRKVIEDPAPSATDLPGPRYGMHIEARGQLLAVGANRKDWGGVHDAGLGFTQRGPTFAAVHLHEHPTPHPSDYVGYRCGVADIVGDGSLDCFFIVMPQQNPNPQALLVWDGDQLTGPPAQVVPVLERSGDHYANGLDAAQLYPGGKEELLLGDPTYDRPGTHFLDNVGRVVVYAF
jgi:hypothetical protein